MKGYKKIKAELGNPPVFLVSPTEFTAIAGDPRMSRGDTWGYSAYRLPVFTVLSTLRGRERDNVIYHEIAHQLWRSKPHWWIECFGEKMAGGGGRGMWSARTGHTPDDLPDRETLIEMAKRRSRHLLKIANRD